MQLQNHFYVIRHGESENNLLGIESCRIETQTKYGLTDEGREQVNRALASAPKFDAIYTSPFRRTIETAQIMAEAQELELSIEFLLHEFKLPSELDQQPYEIAESVIHAPENNFNRTPIGDSESFDIQFDRLKNLLLELDKQHENETILLVTHGSPVEAFIQIMKGKNTGFGPFAELPKNAEMVHLNTLNLIA
jgi:probable phosphoglycerate mutase